MGSWVTEKKIFLFNFLFYLNGMLDGELKYFLKDLNSESQVFSSSHYQLLCNESKAAIKARAKPIRPTEDKTFEV